MAGAEFQLYSFRGTPMRQRSDHVDYEIYRGRGMWEVYGSSHYVKSAAIPTSPEEHAGLIEAHDLGMPDEEFDEEAWWAEHQAEDREIRRGCGPHDLSGGENRK